MPPVTRHPRHVVSLENVEEFADWGPRPATRELQWPQSGISPDALRRMPRDPDETLAAWGEHHGPRLPRRMPVGFGDPPRAEARLAPVFLAGGILAAVLIALLRSF